MKNTFHPQHGTAFRSGTDMSMDGARKQEQETFQAQARAALESNKELNMSGIYTECRGKPVVIRRTGMDDLADLLAGEIHAEIRSDANLFRKTPVVVPNRSIQRYLSLRFAHRYKVSAQIEFLPLMSVIRRFMPRNPGQVRPNINEKTIGWRIYRILLDHDSGNAFPELARWIGGDAQKLYELSGRLGSLYDKYMLYRPEWINAWEAGRQPQGLDKEPAAGWQGELWRRIAGADWTGNHFAAAYDGIIRGEAAPASETERSETIRIFGFSQLPPAVLRCLEEFSRRTVVKVYHLVSSASFYEDAENGKNELKSFLNRCFQTEGNPELLGDEMKDYYFQNNPLVASFAMQSRILLSETNEWEGDTDYLSSMAAVPSVAGNDTILHRLQNRVRRNVRSGELPEDESPDNGCAACSVKSGVETASAKEKGGCRSVQFRSCYSAFREVEAAHNFILHCLDEDPDLSPKDIFIMTPSPSEYAPLVDAVFNHAHDTKRPGATVADQPQTEKLPSYSTLLKALALFKSDFTSSCIFGILQDRELQEHWGFSAEDCRYCLARAMQAGIRWGWNAEEHARVGGNAFPENSWQTGFDRMLLSYAMDADPAAPYRIGEQEDIFPVPGFDGGRAGLLGKFIGLVSKLHGIAQAMRRRESEGVPFREWETWLADSAGCLFGKESALKNLLQTVLSDWRQVLTESGAEEVPLTSGIVLAHLQDKRSRPEDTSMGFMRGKITFCGLRPMRSIPADAILLLGMNHEVFPEKDDNLEFDLMLQFRKEKGSCAGRRPGDPLRRDESRQLFLDTVMAARKYLYISYIGRDIHDRKEKPPSVCADELKQYLIQEFGEGSFVEVQEPIHSFSAELFRPGAVNQSYSEAMLLAARQTGTQARTDDRPQFDIRGGIRLAENGEEELLCREVELQDLIRFFSDPAGTFLAKRLDADVSVRESATPEDTELFEDRKDWKMSDELFRLYMETEKPDRENLKRICLRRMKNNGKTPLTQKEDEWAAWAAVVGVADAMEKIIGNAAEETIPAETATLEYSAADIDDLAKYLFDPVPERAFRTELVLPEMKVCRSGDDAPGSPCILTAWSFSKELSGARLISPVLNHLRANLSRETTTRIVYSENGSKNSVATISAMSRKEAETGLKTLLCLYRAGMRTPLRFFPRTSYKFFETEDEAKAAKVWSNYSSGEVDRFGCFFGNELQIDDCFKALAKAFFGTVFRTGEEGGKA
jgi:exodeoxyribonuclease V gamma subunit